MERRFKKSLPLFFSFLIWVCAFALVLPQAWGEDEEISEIGIEAPSLEQLEMINERFQSLSSGLKDMPTPPNLARTIELPDVKDASEVEEEEKPS